MMFKLGGRCKWCMCTFKSSPGAFFNSIYVVDRIQEELNVAIKFNIQFCKTIKFLWVFVFS